MFGLIFRGGENMAVGVQLQMHKLWHANLEEYGRDEHRNVLFASVGGCIILLFMSSTYICM